MMPIVAITAKTATSSSKTDWALSNMDEFDYWRLCDDLSILQAAPLVVGEDPAQNSYVESWDVEKRPPGYEGAKTAIANALERGDIEGSIIWEFERDINGNKFGDTDILDI